MFKYKMHKKITKKIEILNKEIRFKIIKLYNRKN